MFPIAIGMILFVIGYGAYYIPWYYREVITKPYEPFPESVARKLRRALFYSRPGNNQDLREANKYFRQALQVAQEEGMDQFSPEVLGIKYMIGQLFEHAGHYPLACDVLEIMRVDCERWIREFGDKHWTDGDRARILKVIVQLNLKLGELYDSKYMNQPEDAEKRLTQAVETALREKMRREEDGVKEGEGEWLTNEELGGALEGLGTHYEQNNSHYLATPLFLQALTLCPPKSCHAVVLMNNISTCLAQQRPPPVSATPSKESKSTLSSLNPFSKSTPKTDDKPNSDPTLFPTTPAASRETLLEQAHEWARKAIAHAATIAPPERDQECDIGCAVATHNLGEFFEMQGNYEMAKRKYDEADALGKVLGFEEGRENAREGWRRVDALEKAKTKAAVVSAAVEEKKST